MKNKKLMNISKKITENKVKSLDKNVVNAISGGRAIEQSIVKCDTNDCWGYGGVDCGTNDCWGYHRQ